MTGHLIKFDGNKGYGFIEPASGGEDVFLHVNDLLIPESLVRLGAVLSFEVERGERGCRAVNVALANAPAQVKSKEAVPELPSPESHLDEPVPADPAGPPAKKEEASAPFLRSVLVDDDSDTLCDVLTVEEFAGEVTEVLLAAAPEITGWQVLQLRSALIELAQSHSWLDGSDIRPGIAAV